MTHRFSGWLLLLTSLLIWLVPNALGGIVEVRSDASEAVSFEPAAKVIERGGDSQGFIAKFNVTGLASDGNNLKFRIVARPPAHDLLIDVIIPVGQVVTNNNYSVEIKFSLSSTVQGVLVGQPDTYVKVIRNSDQSVVYDGNLNGLTTGTSTDPSGKGEYSVVIRDDPADNPDNDHGKLSILCKNFDPSIPTLTEWGLIILALLLLGTMTYVLMRRKRLGGLPV